MTDEFQVVARYEFDDGTVEYSTPLHIGTDAACHTAAAALSGVPSYAGARTPRHIGVVVTPRSGPTLTADRAQAIVARARRRSSYVDLEPGDEEVCLEGRFGLEELEAIVFLMKAGHAMPVRWSSPSSA
jgi:hypothetical protein